MNLLPRSEPHQISGSGTGRGLSTTEAQRILQLIERGAQAELHGLAATYRCAPPEADAATVAKRLRNLAEGVLQQAHRMQLTTPP